MLLPAIDRFFSHDAAVGILLMLSAIAAMAVCNSPLAGWYDAPLSSDFSVTLNGEGISKPLILWINDGLTAIFFLIGLELKREFLEDKLKNRRDINLPGVAAVGGMAVPAVIHAALNWSGGALIGSTPSATLGYAILRGLSPAPEAEAKPAAA